MNEKKVQEKPGPVTLKPGLLSRRQLRQVCRMLNRAFFDYPFGVYAFPDPVDRERRAYAFFELMVRYGLKYGEVSVTSMNFEGIVMWLPPEAPFMTNFRMLRSGMLRVIGKVGFKAVSRVLTFSNHLEKIHKEMAGFPHWFGLLLGIHPDYQGRGYAGRFLEAKVEEAGRSGISIYFETQNAGNVGMYRRFGFEVIDESTVPGSNVTSWAMLWSPPKHNNKAPKAKDS